MGHEVRKEIINGQSHRILKLVYRKRAYHGKKLYEEEKGLKTLPVTKESDIGVCGVKTLYA